MECTSGLWHFFLERISRLVRRSPLEYLVYFHNIEQMQL